MNANEFNPLSFDEWKQRNFDLAAVWSECPDCDGTGTGTCPCCGNDDGECENCRGSGKVTGGTPELYEAHMARDRRAWETYFGLPHSESLDEYLRKTAVLHQGEGDEEDPHWSVRRPLVLSIAARAQEATVS